MDRITLALGERSRVVRIRADQQVEVHIVCCPNAPQPTAARLGLASPAHTGGGDASFSPGRRADRVPPAPGAPAAGRRQGQWRRYSQAGIGQPS